MKRSLLVIVVSVALGSCAHLGKRPAPLTLGVPDSGKTIHLTVGQTVIVRLAANPSTGYRWQTTTGPDALVLIVMDAGYDRPSSDAPGTPGRAWWKLRATGVGETSLALRYRRPWAPDERAQEFTLTVIVK